ncbi:hypothetical protein FHR28_000183 [Acinetobacter sp. BIGb0196]|nr:hypothetical protein [Acinetobacter guillouiae]MCW2253235.1 hypothetical protein [Acinetobacter sp. BIGb0204]NII35274.1 hypothetical protein [Acinetobacter sp. BIGb0196]
MDLNFIFLIISLIIYIISYIYSLNFMKRNEFVKSKFSNKDYFSFFEIFEIQLFFFAMYVQYNIFYKVNGKIPFYDEKHNIVMNNFSKSELLVFIKNNYNFLRVFFVFSIMSWVLLFGSIFNFILNN